MPRLVPLLLAPAILWSATAGAADPLILEQAVEAGRSGVTHLLVDRARISSVRVEKDTGLEHSLAVTLDPQSEPRITVRCRDPASARALLEAFRPGGPPVFQATGRCRF